MKHTYFFVALCFAALSLTFNVQAEDSKVIYGSQLMTEQERIQHRNRMRNAKSDEERQQIRMRHHKEMQIRAAERGVTLPETPPARGQGKGKGKGMGQGQGQGMGQGQGKGKGQGYGRN